VLLWLFKHWIQYNTATARVDDVHHPRKYVQLRAGRAIPPVQGEGRDSGGQGRRGSPVGVRCSDQAMNVHSPLSELGRTRSDRRLRRQGLDYRLCGYPVGEYMEVGGHGL